MLVEAARLFGTTHAMAVSGTSTTTGTFSGQTRYIRIVGNTAFHFQNASTPIATTAATGNSPFHPANAEGYFNVTPGEKVAACTAATNGLVTSTNGTVWVTEVE